MPRALLTLLAVALCGVHIADGQEPPAKSTIQIEWSLQEPARDTALWMSVGEALNRGADLALDSAFRIREGQSAAKVAGRLAQMWLVTMPIAAITQVGAHDAGHFARADEVAPGEHVLHVTQWPWPVPLMGTVEWSSGFAASYESPFATLAAIGGGEQGALTLRRRVIDRAYTGDGIGYFDATLLVYATLDFPIYAWADLRPSHLASEADFYAGEVADFRQYVLAGSAVGLPPRHAPAFADMSRFADQIRRSAWLNLADTSLVFAVDRAVRYIASGRRESVMPTLRIGGIRVAAGTYATLGSIGLERGADVRVVGDSFVTWVNVRNVAIPDGRSLWGAGLGLLPRTGDGLRPLAQLDVWQAFDHGTGARLEVGLRRRFSWHSQPFDTGFRAGYKSEGYLPDAPSGRGPLASIFTTIRF